MFLLFYVSSLYHLDYEKLHAVDQAVYFDITENANFAFGGDIPLENGRMGHKNILGGRMGYQRDTPEHSNEVLHLQAGIGKLWLAWCNSGWSRPGNRPPTWRE